MFVCRVPIIVPAVYCWFNKFQAEIAVTKNETFQSCNHDYVSICVKNKYCKDVKV